MNDENLHQLIGDIYETAVSPESWDSLIYQLTEYLSYSVNSPVVSYLPDAQFDQLHTTALNAQNNKTVVNSRIDNIHSIIPTLPAKTLCNQRRLQLSEILNKHFNRAYAISEKIREKNDKATALKLSLDSIPIPILVMEPDCQIIFENEKASVFLQKNNEFLRKSKISLTNPILQRAFEQCVSDASVKKVSTTLPLGLPGQGHFSSLVITPLYSESENQPHISVLIANYDNEIDLSFEVLKKNYSITRAEMQLIEGLIKGYSISELSEVKHRSISTLRSQLKSVFAKTGTSRQAELMRLILLGPSRYVKSGISDNKESIIPLHFRDRTNQYHQLTDGRTIGFAEFGDPQGKVIIGFHPLTGCRYQCHPDEAILYSAGIRFIIPDRPGFGLSTPQPGRSYEDFSSDLEELVDMLQIDQFSLLGYCGGTPYAVASAEKLSDRVKQLILVSPVTPYHEIDLLLGVKTHNRMLVNLATKLPNMMFQFGKVLAKGLIRNPDKYFDDVIAELCETDASALNEPEMLENFKLSLEESLSQGSDEFVNEQIMLVQDWGINPKKLSCETIIWHGEEDMHVPVEYAKQFASLFPDANTRILPGYGHFMIYHLWKDILMDVI